MHVNLPKTSVMSIGTRENLLNSDSIQIYLDEELLRTADNQKLLGIIVMRKQLTGTRAIKRQIPPSQ